ncbi:MAG: hypothetical protein HY259_14085 [Chloroflexi bacterium]|nr:hypothetical protein [Chloroflexota bacterium]MBI3734565.1 hypothetical protein [Chloroflexota bacterium]
MTGSKDTPPIPSANGRRQRLAGLAAMSVVSSLCVGLIIILFPARFGLTVDSAREVAVGRTAGLAETAAATLPVPKATADTPTVVPLPTLRITPLATTPSTVSGLAATPVPRPRDTRTPQSSQFRIVTQRAFPNCGSTGVFGTIRAGDKLLGGIYLVVFRGHVAGAQTASMPNYIGASPDRNYEITPLTKGLYTLMAVDANGLSLAPSVDFTISPPAENCEPGQSGSQWVEIDLAQN